MYRPQQLGKLVSRICQERGLSAFAASKAAGLSMNQIRNMQRGLHRPSPRVLETFVRALGISLEQAAELRRLAGIDPDPAATPEARRARRDAWRLLLYVLVNHVLLPRLELPNILDARHGRRNAELVDLVRRAAGACTHRDFERQVADVMPPRPVLSLIEKHFATLPADDLALAQSSLSLNDQLLDLVVTATEQLGDTDMGAGDELASLSQEFRSFNHGTACRLLPHVAARLVNDGEASLRLREYAFDWSFEVAFYPLLYWHVCRYWPFEKVRNPLARLSIDQQRRLYDAVQRGLDVVEFDRVLLGERRLGAELRKGGTTRPPFYAAAEKPPLGQAHIPLERSFPELLPTFYNGPIPPVDILCDQLDRHELLSRFPLVKIDTASFDELLHERELPSWGAWVQCVREHVPELPKDAPPLGPRKFASVLSNWSLSLGTGAADRAAGSATLHRLADHLRTSAWLKLQRGHWADVLAAAKVLSARPHWIDWLGALAERSNAP